MNISIVVLQSGQIHRVVSLWLRVILPLALIKQKLGDLDEFDEMIQRYQQKHAP